jgi:hypothetical protein
MGVHERRRKSSCTALVSVSLVRNGQDDFFVRGDFLCFSFVWQTKEKRIKKNNEAALL